MLHFSYDEVNEDDLLDLVDIALDNVVPDSLLLYDFELDHGV